MRPALRAPLLFAFGCALTACTLSNEGITPPARQFHYPIAAAISADSHWLYVVNSDFNLQYNGARVNVVDLEEVERRRGQSTFVVENEVMSQAADATVRINPFATAAFLRRSITHGLTNVTVGPRLYITVRGDGTLTYLDANGEHLDCGQGSGDLCDDAHRVGQVPTAPRNLTLPPLPVTLWADDEWENPFVVVVHQESPRARASLFFDPIVNGSSPLLVHYADNLSPNLGAVVRAPVSTVPGASRDPHYYLFSRLESSINQMRVRNDDESSYLYRTHLDIPLDLPVDSGIRAVVMDPRNSDPASGIHRMYATARPGAPDASGATHSPEQLIAFDITDPDNVLVLNTMPLPTGPSNLVMVPQENPDAPMLAYTVSYDARKMYVIDVDHWREYDEIRTNRGPHWPVFDPLRHHLLLVDFAAMVVEVIDVDSRNAGPNGTFDHVIFTIGDTILPDLT